MRPLRTLRRLVLTPIGVATAVLLVGATLWLSLGRDAGGNRSVTTPTADAAYYYAFSPSIWIDHDLDFANQYEVTGNWYKFAKTKTGRYSNVFGIGPAVFEAPFFAAGHALAVASGSRRDGFSGWEESLSMWASIPFTIGAILLAWRIARRRLRSKLAAFAGPLAVVLAGPVLYYAVRQPGYSHPFATFFCTLLIERWDASYGAPRTLRTWLVLGLVTGATVLARPQLAPWGLVCLAAAVDDLRSRAKTPVPLMRLGGRWAVAALASLLVFLPQLLAWRAIYGHWYLVPQGSGFMRWDQPALTEVLFSARNGLFPWAPLYLPCLIGLVLLARTSGRLVTGLLAGFIVQTLINGAVWDWWAGGSYGGRRFDSCYVVFALGGAALLDRAIGWITSARPALTRWWHVRRAAAAVGVLVAGLVIAANVELAGRTSVQSARIKGGEPPDLIWRNRVGGVHGAVASALSAVASFPMRVAFAWSHDVDLYTYDRVVGVYALGETFPGLNSHADLTKDVVSLDETRLVGLTALPDGHARLETGTGRILVGVNRRGSIRVAITWSGAATLGARWNDGPLQRRTASSRGGGRIEFLTRDLRRRINVVEIVAAPGVVLDPIELEAGE